MKISIPSLALALSLASSVSGHYIFQQLSVGSTKYPIFQYIRKNSNYNSPVTGDYPSAEDILHLRKTADLDRPRFK